MCGPTFGAQQLAAINKRPGRAHLFGVHVPGLAVMAMAFGRNGILYAVGDCNPAPPPSFECTLDSDFNSLYKVNVTSRVVVTRSDGTLVGLFFAADVPS